MGRKRGVEKKKMRRKGRNGEGEDERYGDGKERGNKRKKRMKKELKEGRRRGDNTMDTRRFLEKPSRRLKQNKANQELTQMIYF